MRIKNWREFQHYKHRSPPWIRFHRSLLDDLDWHKLEGDAAKALVMLWLIASEDEGSLPEAVELAFRLRISEKQLNSIVSKLSHWLEQDASSALAPCLHHAVSEESRVETEKSRVDSAQGAAISKPDNGNSRKKAAIALSDAWLPNSSSTQKAQKLGLTQAEIGREREKFRNHARQNDRRAVNWDAAFDNWCIKAAEFLNRAPLEAKTDGFSAPPGSPEFQAWRTHFRDTNQKGFVGELDKRQLEGRAFNFASQWPPGHSAPKSDDMQPPAPPLA